MESKETSPNSDRIVEGQAPNGTIMRFRVPTPDEYEVRHDRGDKPDTVAEREFCFALRVAPDLDDLKRIFARWPGLPRAATEAIEEQAGDSIEFFSTERRLPVEFRERVSTATAELPEFRCGLAPDGTLIVLQPPLDAAWNHFRDSRKSDRGIDRLRQLTQAMLVLPQEGAQRDRLLEQYPAIVEPISAQAVDLVGAKVEFAVKKG